MATEYTGPYTMYIWDNDGSESMEYDWIPSKAEIDRKISEWIETSDWGFDDEPVVIEWKVKDAEGNHVTSGSIELDA